MIAKAAASAYERVGLETGVAAANPARLVVMLYDGTLAAIADARRHIACRDTAAKGRAIGKAIRIVGEGLKGSLDLARGGAIAAQLDALYTFVEQKLLQGNLDDDVNALDDAARLLVDIRPAWDALAVQAASGASR
jgi:flagellar protein FliS